MLIYCLSFLIFDFLRVIIVALPGRQILIEIDTQIKIHSEEK